MAKKKAKKEPIFEISEEESQYIEKLQEECDILTNDLNEFFANNYSADAIAIVCATTVKHLLIDKDFREHLSNFTMYIVTNNLVEGLGIEAARQAIAQGDAEHPIVEAVESKYGKVKL